MSSLCVSHYAWSNYNLHEYFSYQKYMYLDEWVKKKVRIAFRGWSNLTTVVILNFKFFFELFGKVPQRRKNSKKNLLQCWMKTRVYFFSKYRFIRICIDAKCSNGYKKRSFKSNRYNTCLYLP